MTDPMVEHRDQITLWHENDIKGNRMRNYMKEVGKKNQCIMTIVKQTRLEQAHNYTDGHKCLNFRKKIMKLRIHVSDAALRIASNKFFEGFIIVVISLNCITLAQSDANKEETPAEKNIDLAFNIIYTIEMFLRVFALGFVWNKGAYLRSYWNQLDFICVCTAYLEIVGGGGTSLGALRAFRVLRPLRFVNNIQGLKIVVSSVMVAIPVLQETIIVLFFFFLIFAIGGLNLFMGMLKARCFNIDTGSTFIDDDGNEVICGALACPSGYQCGKQTLNPNYDVTNFDNIFWALLNVFQCITMEGWSEIMVMYQQAYTPWTFFFFTPMVFIGSFFLLNLTLAVIQSSYSETQNKIKQEKARIKAEQEELTVKNQKQKNTEEGGVMASDQAEAEAEAKRNLNIGVDQFFVAKRAAVKMKLYWKRHKLFMEQQEIKNAKKEEEESKAIKEQQRKEQQQAHQKFLRRQNLHYKNVSQRSAANDSVRSAKSLATQQKTEDLGAGFGTDERQNTEELEEKVLQQMKEEIALEEKEREDNEDNEQNQNKTITEESVIEEVLSAEDVQNFLRELGSDAQMTPQNFKDNLTNKSLRVFNPVMAFNDVRISVAREQSVHNFTREMQQVLTPMRNNLLSKNSMLKERTIKGDERNIRSNPKLDKFFKDLDYDKVVSKQQLVSDYDQIETKQQLISDYDQIASKQQLISDSGDSDERRRNRTQQDFTEHEFTHQNEFTHQMEPLNSAQDLFAVEHPLDLSFTKDKDYGKRNQTGYASDNGRRESLNQSIGDFKSSIISSDESIAAKLEQNQQFGGQLEPKDLAKRRNNARMISTEDGNFRFKRMLTSELKEKSKMNESQSTYLGHNPSFRQQIDCLSGLQPTRKDPDEVQWFRMSKEKDKSQKQAISASDQTQQLNKLSIRQINKNKDREAQGSARLQVPSNSNRANYNSNQMRVIKNRKEKLQIYKEIDRDWFNPDKPTNPMQFIDNVKQKVIINPGVQYVSTSQNEIFERRIMLNQKEHLNKINPFIAAPQDYEKENETYMGKKEESYIQCMFQPYQLKTQYLVKQVEEIDWDSVDEDLIVLAQQPYETVMQTGFSNYLNHLSTKFIARRSDIVVSSTLSITLTPIDDGFQPTHFATIDGDEIWDYVMNRQEYRAMSIKSNNIKLGKQKYFSLIESGEDSFFSNNSKESLEEFDSQDEDMNDLLQASMVLNLHSSICNNKLKLPACLLSKELPGQRALLLSKKERRLYKIQQQKHQQKMKQLEKIKSMDPEKMPIKRVFKIEEARQLVKGTFKHEIEDDEYFDKSPNKPHFTVGNKVILNRAMTTGANDPQHEIALDCFDNVVQNAILDHTIPSSFGLHDPRINQDHVPETIKKAFNLPKDMRNYDIDFEEVRSTDAQFKRQVHIWSGQEVLDITLNMQKSHWVLNQINKLRVWPKGFYNITKKFRAFLKSIIRFSLFDNFLTACVLMNTVVMGMDSYDIDTATAKDLEFLNEIFTWIFIVEMCIKLLAIGPRKYSANIMNLLDGGVVLLSIIEMVMAALGGGGGAGNLQAFRTVRVFRTFRVLRVTRVLRALKSMAMVIGVIQRSMMDFVLITILMFVFIFIYTLLGRQIFQGKYDFGPYEELPRSNFESFSVAFMTVFQVLTMENWQQALFISMRAAEGSMIFKTITALYYISWIFIGNFILLNLFLAILIDAFAMEDADMDNHEEDEAAQKLASELKQKTQMEIKEKRMKKLGTSMKMLQSGRNTISPKKKNAKKKQIANFTGVKRLREEDLSDIEEMSPQEIRIMLVENGILKARADDHIDYKLVGTEIEAENSVYLFARKSCFRRNVHFLQKHKWFENFIMLLIALSSTKLALESYLVDLPQDHKLVIISNELDFIFNYLFIVECILKVIALGFAMDEGSYMRDSWNRLDFFIVVTSIIDMMLTNTDIPALKVLRMLRMIRPLRVISHNQQLKMIVAALFESVGSIINVSVIVMIIWLMFAIYGMNTFMGMFFYCSINPYKHNTKWVCQNNGGTWEIFDSNFDNIGQAMLTLFIVASREGWPDIMYKSIDVTKRDNGPKYEASPGQAIFFVIFILIGSFFFLNFFIGVLFLKYEQAQKKEEAGFSKQQLYWQEISRLIVAAKTPHKDRYKPQFISCQLRIWQLVESDFFDYTIMICIVLNMFQMALDHDGASPGTIMFLKVSNYIFTAIFFIEAVLKLYVYRQNYFKTSWNKFDFFVVASSLCDLALEASMPKVEGGQEDQSSEILSVGPQLARVMRVMRVTRVLRLAGRNKELLSLLKTIVMSVDSLFNVFILLMLIFFIMAVLGNTMFHMVTVGEKISDYKNFMNFHQSFQLLFSISTGEDWNIIMYDCMRTPPSCIPGKTCGNSIAPVFFLSFNMIVSNIMLNLFILVIIQQFQKYFLDEDNPLTRFETDFDEFYSTWKIFTPRYQCTKIKTKQLKPFFLKLPQRIRSQMGINDNIKEEEFNRLVLKMGINVDNGFIYFNEMLYRIMRQQFVVVRHLKFNKVMTVHELATQFKISELTLKEKSMSKKISKEAREKAFFEQHAAQPVNLFLTKMFFKTSFITWRNQMRVILQHQRWEKQVSINRTNAERLGTEFITPRYPEVKSKPIQIEVEKETQVVLSCSEDEEDEFDSRNKQSYTTQKIQSEWTKSLHQESPDVFRLKARLRMNQSVKKFTLEKLDSDMDLTPNKKQKRALVAHTNEEVEASKNHIFVDPNSMEYQNIVLEHKLNKHEKILQKFQVKVTSSPKNKMSTYSGIFSKENINQAINKLHSTTRYSSPQRLNAPPKLEEGILSPRRLASPRSKSMHVNLANQ